MERAMPEEPIRDAGDRVVAPDPMARAAAVAAAAGLPPPPERRNGRLTRRGMEQVIQEGGSVLVREPDPDLAGQTRTRLVLRVEDLPSEAELSVGDTELMTRARETLLEQQREIQRQLATLESAEVQPRETEAPKPTEGAPQGQAPAARGEAPPRQSPAGEARDVRPEVKGDPHARK
jgi:hypothetical protein